MGRITSGHRPFSAGYDMNRKYVGGMMGRDCKVKTGGIPATTGHAVSYDVCIPKFDP
jgi:hypothetical protein